MDGDASDQKDANGVQQPEGDSLAMEEEEVGDDTDDQEGAGKVNWSHSESLGVRPLRSMQARLYIQHDGQEFKHRERPPVQQNPEAQPRSASDCMQGLARLEESRHFLLRELPIIPVW